MIIQVASDLHLEFYNKDTIKTLEFVSVEDRDLLILAGDIGINLGAYQFILDQLDISPVVYVPGNHEYYAFKLHEEIDAAWRSLAIANSTQGLHYLVDDLVEINGIKIYGTPLYSDLKGNGPMFENVITDFSSSLSWDASDHQFAHERDVNRLSGVNIADIVVTHWPVTKEAQSPRFKDDKYGDYFVNDLPDLVKKAAPKYWLSGHVHDAYRYQIQNTSLLGNPRGYPSETPSKLYRPDFTITL